VTASSNPIYNELKFALPTFAKVNNQSNLSASFGIGSIYM